MAEDNLIQPYYTKMRRKGKKVQDEFELDGEEEAEVAKPVDVTGVAKIRDILKKKKATV